MTDKNIEIKGVKLRSTIIPGKTPSPHNQVSEERESGQKPKEPMQVCKPLWKTPKHPASMTAEELERWQKRRSRLPARVRARDSWLDGPLRNLTMKNEYRFTQNDLHHEKSYFPVRTFNRGWTFHVADVDKDNPCIGYINMEGFPKWIDLVVETTSNLKLWRDVKLLGVDKVVNTGKGVNHSDDLDLSRVPVEFSSPVSQYEGILCTAKTYTLGALPYELDGSYNAFVDFQRRIACKQRYMERHPATPNHDYDHPGIWVRYNGAQLNCLYDILVWGDLLYRDCYLTPEGWVSLNKDGIVKQWSKEEIFAVRVAVGVDGKHKPIPDTVTDAVYQDIPAIAVWGENTQAFFPIKG